jgi:hypothetical protein
MQIFSTLIVSCFQSINPDKDEETVKGTSDLKNEIKIITSPKDMFELWKDFLKKHSSGALINLDKSVRFN